MLPCGHKQGETGDHTECPVGHWRCDGDNHESCMPPIITIQDSVIAPGRPIVVPEDPKIEIDDVGGGIILAEDGEETESTIEQSDKALRPNHDDTITVAVRIIPIPHPVLVHAASFPQEFVALEPTPMPVLETVLAEAILLSQ